MAGFKTHITFSSTLGVGYAAGGYLLYDMPWPSCAIAGAACGVAGMLPDLDSGSGRPIRESMTFAAAIVPMLCLARFEALALPHEMMVVAAAALYVLIRFGASWALSKYTVHRGMFHSIPAAVLAGLVTFLIIGSHNVDIDIRLFKAGAVFTGYMSHLLLDEIWSFEWRGGLLRTKKSFGTALKFWGGDLWGNVSLYGKLAVVAFLTFGDVTMLADHLPASDRVEQALAPAETAVGRFFPGWPNTDPQQEPGPVADRHAPQF